MNPRPCRGRYVAHVIDDGGQQSLWVRQTAAPSDAQIVPPAAGASYRGFTFSPDSKQIALSRGAQTGDVVLIKDFR